VPGLGRLIAKDPRDHQFRLAAHPLASAVVSRKSKTWSIFVKPLDQGNTGTCVAHAWKGRLLAAPVIHRQTEEPSPFQLYDECIKLDEWTENDVDPDRQYGTSVRAGAKALVARGLISEYRWTDQVDEAADWISGVDSEGNFVGGPVVIGIDWFYGMFTPDPSGTIHPTGGVAGGHCVLLIGWDEKRGRFRGLNSWGSNWSQNGRFWLSGEDAQTLFDRGGEVCIPSESARR
jgi:hypothetical protein